MQTMLYGYAGLRLFPDRLTLAPKLPPHTTNVTLTHVRRGTRVGAGLPAHGPVQMPSAVHASPLARSLARCGLEPV